MNSPACGASAIRAAGGPTRVPFHLCCALAMISTAGPGSEPFVCGALEPDPVRCGALEPDPVVGGALGLDAVVGIALEPDPAATLLASGAAPAGPRVAGPAR
jgi:hypothetical protein